MLAADIDLIKARHLRATVSGTATPETLTLGEMMLNVPQAKRFRATSFEPLDKRLGGGLATGTVSEVVGPSGCGKTQFCLTHVVETVARLWETHASVVYIDTEGTFSAERLMQIASARHPTLAASPEFAERVLVYAEPTSSALLQRYRVGLVLSRG